MPWLQEFGGWAGRPDCRSLGGGQAGHPFFPPPRMWEMMVARSQLHIKPCVAIVFGL